MADFVGRQIGNYTIVRLLGTGGFADVYLGEHIYLKSQAAIKILSVQFGVQGEESFLAEARTLVGLRHPHIVQVFDFGMEGNTPYLVMQYAPNGNLHQRYPKGTRLSPAMVVPFVKQVASALQFAHDRRLIHRDVKPENMLVGDNNDILLADFGIATIAQSTYESQNGVTGTVTYMAPEQIRGKPTFASDQYALAVVVYEWLSGSGPFQGSFSEMCAQHIYAKPALLREKIPGLAPAIDQVIQTALEKEPGQRFETVQAFANALEHACQAAERGPAARQPLVAQEKPATYYDTYPLPEPEQKARNNEARPAPQPPIPQLQASQYATVPSKQEAKNLYGVVPPPPGTTYYAPSRESAPQVAVPQQTTPPKKSRTGCAIACAVTAVLLLLAGGVIFSTGALAYIAYVVAPHTSATATVRPGTAGPRPTAVTPASTATTGGSVTPVASQTAQNLYTTATSGTPVLDDSLTGPSSSGWDVDASGKMCAYTGGAYHARIAQTGSFIPCYAEATAFQNFAYQVNMTFVTGTKDDGGGLVIRNTANGEYRLRVGVDGSYDFVGPKNGLLSGSSPAIKTGPNQTNVLTIIAQGQQVYIYINQQYVAGVDSGNSSSGKIGVFAVCWTQPTDVAFSHARVWQL